MTISENNSRPRRVSDALLQTAFAKLDERGSKPRARNRRSGTRLRFRRTNLPVKIINNSGPAQETIMACWDLSATGICVLHTAFLHKGTELRLSLKRHLGGEDIVAGTVTWCAHVEGKMHAFGVRFHAPIFVKHFLGPEECKELLRVTDGGISELKGTILYVDDQEMDKALFSFYLKPTSCVVTLARNTQEALAAIKAQPIDMVVCDLNLGAAKGEETIAALRTNGFKGRIIAITAESSPERLKAAQTAGADGGVLQKPYDRDSLLRHLATLLSETSASGEAVYSSLADAPGLDVLLQQYIDQVQGMVKEIEAAVGANDLTSVRRSCQNLKGTGNGYGYVTLSQAAQDALTALDSSQSVAESETEIRLLASLCTRLKPARAK